MIEANAFLAAFTVQVLTMSVLYPARLIKHARVQATHFPAERLAQVFPGVDIELSQQRFWTRFRAVNTGIAVLGLLLLGWFFDYTQRPDWDEGPVIGLLCVYYVMQVLPILFVTWRGLRLMKQHKQSLLDAKRTAVLQRRGLFDFISPFIVFLAGSGYLLFVALVIYVQPKPSPGFGLIGVLTLVYALEAFVVYRALYGKKANPLETHAGRVHKIGQTVRVCVYGCIVCVVFFSFAFWIDLLDAKRWVPFGQSVCLLASTLLCLMALTAPPRVPDAEDLGARTAH